MNMNQVARKKGLEAIRDVRSLLRSLEIHLKDEKTCENCVGRYYSQASILKSAVKLFDFITIGGNHCEGVPDDIDPESLVPTKEQLALLPPLQMLQKMRAMFVDEDVDDIFCEEEKKKYKLQVESLGPVFKSLCWSPEEAAYLAFTAAEKEMRKDRENDE